MMKDYYYILGLTKQASQDEIKKAYRKLSLKFHPDQNNGDLFFQDRFRDLKEAYDTLGNETQKRVYDEEFLKPKASTSTIVSEEVKVEPMVKTETPKSPVSIIQEKDNDEYWYIKLIVPLIFIIAGSDLFYFNFLTENVDITIWLGGTFIAWYFDRKQKNISKLKKDSK